MIVIEKNIPIPAAGGRPFGEDIQALRSMEAGDSFVIDAKRRNTLLQRSKKHGLKVITRKTDDGKVRVWKKEAA